MTGAEWFGAAPGGLNRYFTDLFGALTARSEIEVSAAAFGTAPAGGLSWGPVGGSTWRRARTAYRDRWAAAPGRAAVLDRHFTLYGPPVRDSRAGHLVVHFHGPWAAESRAAGSSAPAAGAKYALERLRARPADKFVVLSTHFRDLLVHDYKVRPDAVTVIAPGVDLDRFRPAPAPEPTAPVVLCVRRLEHRMGIDVLLRAWPAVRAAHPTARLILVGTGTAESGLREQARDLGPSVTFTGRVTDAELTGWYARAAVTVVPSVALEGFGLIALESLAAGRAPVVTGCGGLPDSVRDLDPTLIVTPGDADALATRLGDALHGAIPGPDRCRAHAETFSWAAAADRHIALYRELTG
ncbi:glycosyltransferase family 4 protein [Nocardia sp. NBC_01329]|uniref:glycosyltransferase family 4 protein n=1 Tax=Nocardia sp. NBC_01329 TaxID=2903594 RepID=UPI002E162F3D|nr:glycosyltransferase family 4 protein [Nocardia sp. NBC_01329]